MRQNDCMNKNKNPEKTLLLLLISNEISRYDANTVVVERAEQRTHTANEITVVHSRSPNVYLAVGKSSARA